MNDKSQELLGGLAPEIAETGAELLDIAKDIKLPGVSLVAGVIDRVHAAVKERRAREFFTRLAVALGCHDADAAAAEVEGNLHHRWAEEAVDRGFRLMMATAHDELKPAVAALIAEQFIERKSLARDFQRVGALLIDCTPGDISLLKSVSEHVGLAAASSAPGMRALVRGERGDNTSAWLSAWGPEKRTSAVSPSPPVPHSSRAQASLKDTVLPFIGAGWVGAVSREHQYSISRKTLTPPFNCWVGA